MLQFSLTKLYPKEWIKAFVCACIASFLLAQYMVPADSVVYELVANQSESMDFPEELPSYRFQPLVITHHNQPSGSAVSTDAARGHAEVHCASLPVLASASQVKFARINDVRAPKVPLWLWNCSQLI